MIFVWVLLAIVLVFLICMLSGYPIAWVLGGVGLLFGLGGAVVYTRTGHGPNLNLTKVSIMIDNIWTLSANETLVAVPLFIFMGLMLDRSGIAERMMSSMQALFGRLRGGLALTVVVIGVILAASTGIIGASVVLLGLLGLPAMLKQGYAVPLATGTVCAAGTLGILMPPSIMLVVMAERSNTSPGDLFMGAVLPALLLSAAYMVYLLIVGWLRPAQTPLPALGADAGASRGWGLLRRVLLDMLPALLLILCVLGSIMKGIATPTVAAGIGAAMATVLAYAGPKRGALLTLGWLALTGAYHAWIRVGATDTVAIPPAARWTYAGGIGLLALFALLSALPRLRRDWRSIGTVGIQTAQTCGYIFAIFVGAAMFSLTLKKFGGDTLIKDGVVWLEAQAGPHTVIIAALLLVFLMGFVFDWIEITIIVLPLLAPAIGAMDLGLVGIEKAGVVWFVMLMALCLQTSFLTPPVGFAIFFLKGVAPRSVELRHIYRGVIPFVIIQLIVLAIAGLFPQLVIWLPHALAELAKR